MQNKQLVTAGVALTIMGILAGCGTGNGTTSATGNTVTKKVNTSSPSATTAKTSDSLSKSIAIKGKSPTWLVHDLKLASEVHFPVSGQTYALNWNPPADVSGVHPFDALAETKDLWIAGYTGDKNQKSNSFYFGPYDVKGLYKQVKKGTQLFKKATYVFMLESGSKSEGVGQLVPAISIDLGNGAFMAFSSNQIITKSDHAGTDQYVVYPVEGIKLPNQ